jgi:putative ABC transport system substrate-binding protein
MRRRDFLTVVSGAVSWSFAARAQQVEAVRQIGAFIAGTADDPVAQTCARVFREGLQALGWIEGKNVRVDYRWTGGDADHLRSDTANLVSLAPEVIISGGTPATRYLKEETRTIPIVFVHVADPLSGGVVQTLAHPGGNVTGFTAYESSIGGKWLELLKEVSPGITQVLVLVDATNPSWRFHVPTIEAAARALGIRITEIHVYDSGGIELATSGFAGQPNVGIIVLPGLLLDNADWKLIIGLAEKHRIPAIYGSRRMVTNGGLLYYSSDWVELYRRAASYVDQILKGVKPSELPVQQPTKYYLSVNLKTANSMELAVPERLLARADEVIE